MTIHILSFLAGFGLATLLMGLSCALAWPRSRREPQGPSISTLPRRLILENTRLAERRVDKADSALPPSYWRGVEPMPGQWVRKTPPGIFGTEQQAETKAKP